MAKDNDIVTWDVPYKQKKDGSPDRIISVRASRNSSKSEIQELFRADGEVDIQEEIILIGLSRLF